MKYKGKEFEAVKPENDKRPCKSCCFYNNGCGDDDLDCTDFEMEDLVWRLIEPKTTQKNMVHQPNIDRTTQPPNKMTDEQYADQMIREMEEAGLTVDQIIAVIQNARERIKHIKLEKAESHV